MCYLENVIKKHNKHVRIGYDYFCLSWRIPSEGLEQKMTTYYGQSFCTL